MNIINFPKTTKSYNLNSFQSNKTERNISSNKEIPKIKFIGISKNKKLQKINSNRALENSLLNKYYWCDIPSKIKETNNVILGEYKRIKKKFPREIENSLIGDDTKMYDKIKKAIRFWGSFCNYAYPIIQSDKFKVNKKLLKNLDNDFNFDNLRKKNKIKLPKLYTNSSEKYINLKKNNKNFNSFFGIKKSKSVMKIFIGKGNSIL